MDTVDNPKPKLTLVVPPKPPDQPETPDPPDRPLTLAEQLESLRDRVLQVPVGEFRENYFAQGSYMAWLARIWPSVTDPETRGDTARQLYGHFPRVARAADPVACFNLVASLHSDEDVQRALMVHPRNPDSYQLDPGEERFPTTGWLGRYLEYAKYNHIPLAFHFWVAAGILGCACRRNFYLDRGTFRIWPNHYIILSGKKATGKSNALDTGMDVLFRLNRQLSQLLGPDDSKLYRVNILPEDVTQESLIKELSEMNEPRGEKDKLTGLNRVGWTDATGVIPCDELSNLLGKQTWAAGKRVPFLTSVAFKETYTKGTAKDGRTEVHNLALSLLACTAPEWMRNTISSDALSGGFLDRLIVSWRPPSRRVYSRPPPLDPLLAEDLAAKLIPFTKPADPIKQRMELTPEAEAVFDRWYTRTRHQGVRDQDDYTLTSLERLSNSALWLSALMSVSEGENPWITANRFEQALAIMEAEEPFYMEFIQRATERDDAQYYGRIKQFVADQGGETLQMKITQRFSRLKGMGSAAKVCLYLDTMLKNGEMERRPAKCGGVWWSLPGQGGKDES